MNATKPAAEPAIAVAVFDLGGVLVELGSLTELLGTELPAEEFWPRWLASPAVRAFERGMIDTDAFGQGLVEDFGLAIRPDEVIVNFGRFPNGLFPGAAELVGEVGRSASTAILSNTNALHWETQPDAAVIMDLVDQAFLSYQLGMVKPDAEIFERVITDLAVEPATILFLDDNELNVSGARKAGMQAEQVRGIDEARHALARYGLVA